MGHTASPWPLWHSPSGEQCSGADGVSKPLSVRRGHLTGLQPKREGGAAAPRGVLEGGARHVEESADRYEPAFLSHWEEERGTTLRGGLATIYVKSRHSEFPGLRVNFRSSVSSLLMNRNWILFLLSFWPFFLVCGQQRYSLSPFSLLLTLIACQLPASQIEIFLESVCRPQQPVCVYWNSTSFFTPHLCYNRIFYLL